MKRLSLTAWIFIGMAVGIGVGLLAPEPAKQLSLVSSIFLRLIKSIVAPLLFATLVHGIAGAGTIRQMGRIGLKAILYFEAVTTIALVLGLAAVNIVRPGEGVALPGAAGQAPSQAPKGLGEIIEHAFPTSVFDALARNDLLQIVVFAFIFGAACAAAGARARPVAEFLESLAEVMFQYTRYIMYLAPLGVGAAMAATVAGGNFGLLIALGKLVLTMYAAQILFLAGVLGAVALLARVPLSGFYQAVREPFLIAFSTASSEAALPLALENMEKFGLPKRIVSFVIPTGYSLNLDGTTLYLSLASIFVAQVVGVELTLAQQLRMMLILMLTSKGVAGVRGGALVVLAGTLASFELPKGPVENAVNVLVGIDALLDMVRTSVNVVGNCLAAAVIARWEGIAFKPRPAPG